MTVRETSGRVLDVAALARVEGEGAIHVRIDGDQVVGVELDIYEPPRFFEAFLRGRGYQEPPDITARICGICPVAYQMSSVTAIEQICGVTVDGQLAALRRLLYCGEWIESHALHVYLLHAPDFLGYDGGISMARDHRDVVERGLRLKQIGNRLMEVVGGRAIHPINVRVGGFYSLPDVADLRALVPDLQWAVGAALDTVAWVAGFEMPAYEGDWDLVALAGDGDYPIIGRTIATSTSSSTLPIEEFSAHAVEEHVAHSNALHATWDARTYLVGPLARYSLNHHLLTQVAREAAAAAGLGPVCRNPFASIVVRSVELVTACEEALRLIREYDPPAAPSVPVQPRAGVGHGASEAPRGLLYHRYELDDEGTIRAATIVPPTSQNQRAIELDLQRVAQAGIALGDDALRARCEQSVRNHDPCISCATHALRVELDRDWSRYRV
ncbi:MAG TPA: Ni/Fe hydrogenase subunit alpha [Candidatus Nanopelagicales bacterium]|nr:Ni/Fe hydrogenase subunit alpha [Candidatus Nanopelagicales bacterium]